MLELIILLVVDLGLYFLKLWFGIVGSGNLLVLLGMVDAHHLLMDFRIVKSTMKFGKVEIKQRINDNFISPYYKLKQ